MEHLISLGVLLLGIYLIYRSYTNSPTILQQPPSVVYTKDPILENAHKELQKELFIIQEELGEEREKSRELLSQKKSSETRLGQISEHVIPFLQGCPYNPKDLHFLGNPIDYVIFDFDQGEITFLEVKTGNSKQSKRQKIIKNIIKSGKVYFAEMRIDQKGTKHKRYDNNESSIEVGNVTED